MQEEDRAGRATTQEKEPATEGKPRQRSSSKTRGPRRVELPDAVPVHRLAEFLGMSSVEVIKQLMRNGVMANINQVLDYDIAATVVVDFGLHPVRQAEAGAATGSGLAAQVEEDPSLLQTRPPVVTILGHVDHGKTTLLDAIRHSNVIATEVGGITQHIGAYQVEYQGQRITFLDTPGHEAFTAMRARGAQVTDIAILMVAADDGVMPQTVEAINHVKAAQVPIIVAINKIDLPGADPERVKQQLTEYELVVEEWGGEVIAVEVSAKEQMGIDELLANILVVAEVSELKANPDRPARGVVIEARLDKTRGPIAAVLVQGGTLKTGDTLVVGRTWGRVKALFTETGQRLKQAGPSAPVDLLGLNEQPETGDTLEAVGDERKAKERVARRHQEQEQFRAASPTLEEVYSRIQSGEIKDLNLILKTDVQGTVDAVREALENLVAARAKVHIIHAASGTITESDVMLAIASNAIIVGFTTRPEPGARRLAEASGVEVRYYDIIYRLMEDIQKALEGLFVPEEREVIDGHAEVRAVFSLGKRGKIAGVLVRDGKVTRNSWIRVMRGEEGIHEGRVSSLKHFKDDVREMAAGFECGVGVDGFNDFQENDVLEVFHREMAAS